MNFPGAANGFLFLAVMTGIMSFFGAIFTCMGFSEREDWKWLMAIAEGILIAIFLTSGFMGYALK